LRPKPPPTRERLAQLGDQINALVENRLLLFRRHGNRIFMTITMNPDFVPSLSDCFHLFRKRLNRMPWNEPGRLDSDALE
jgi:hypothetical protein